MCVHFGEGNKSSGTFYHLLGDDQAQVFASQALLASLTHDASADNDIFVFVIVFYLYLYFYLDLYLYLYLPHKRYRHP